MIAWEFVLLLSECPRYVIKKYGKHKGEKVVESVENVKTIRERQQ